MHRSKKQSDERVEESEYEECGYEEAEVVVSRGHRFYCTGWMGGGGGLSTYVVFGL